MSRDSITQHVQDAGIVAVLRVTQQAAVRPLAEALRDGGITALEVTMTVPGAVEIIEELASALDDCLVGAGTVLDAATARQVVQAGARFVVSPVFDASLVASIHDLGAAAMPGCFTPTEIFAATRAGADIVKVFPAGAVGPGFFKDVLAPLPALKLMPTGGVTLQNARDWIKAGAVAVGIGTALLDPAAIREGRFDVITERARQLVESIRAVRASS